jgi:nicotinamidase-related amidase
MDGYRRRTLSGSDLDIILRSGNIRHLNLAGIATSGVVLSTLLEAADKDYQLTVLSDGCADSDPDLHETLLSALFPRVAQVIPIHEWKNQLKNPDNRMDSRN